MDRRWMETELDTLSGSFLTQEHGWLMLILSPQLSFAFIPSALNLYPHPCQLLVHETVLAGAVVFFCS